MLSIETITFAISFLSLVVAIAAFTIGDKENNRGIRYILGGIFLLLTLVFGLLGFSSSLESAEPRIPLLEPVAFSPMSTLVTSPTNIAISTITPTDLCISAKELATREGWTYGELRDYQYGGYRIILNSSSKLPELWEANLLDSNGNLIRQIFQQDNNRSMEAGSWIIYLPYQCRSQYGFPKPTPNSSESPCVHPESLAEQKEWQSLGLVDTTFGGYKVLLTTTSTLPEYWEANYYENGQLMNQIFEVSDNRQMNIGEWIIYTPYHCRNTFGYTGR